MPRLFFDEPLSEALCEALADIFPNSLHIRLLGQGGAADAIVWDLARQHECLVVSKDEDFHRLAVLRGAPPKQGPLFRAHTINHVTIYSANVARSKVFYQSLTGLPIRD